MKAKLPLVLFASILGAIPALPATITGGSTNVMLNSNFVSLVTGAGITPSAVAPATLTGTTAMFPITGGDTTTGIIDHSGGLSFTKGTDSAVIQDFVIDLNSMSLSGQVIANGGSPMANVMLFNIGSGNTLSVSPALAADLSAVFGVPNLTGTAVGVATVSPVTGGATPEPAAFGLLLVGLPIGLAVTRLRSRSRG